MNPVGMMGVYCMTYVHLVCGLGSTATHAPIELALATDATQRQRRQVIKLLHSSIQAVLREVGARKVRGVPGR
jgi:hypothetical protein